MKLFHIFSIANEDIKYSIQRYLHYEEIQKVCLINLTIWHHTFPTMYSKNCENSIFSRLGISQMQNVIATGILLSIQKVIDKFSSITFVHLIFKGQCILSLDYLIQMYTNAFLIHTLCGMHYLVFFTRLLPSKTYKKETFIFH